MEESRRRDPDEMLRVGKVRTLSGLGNSQIRRDVKAGKLAEPVILGGARCWRRADVEAWLNWRRGMPLRVFPGADAGREKGHGERSEEAELRDEFARAFDASPDLAMQELRRWSLQGRCSTVPANARRACIVGLHRVSRLA
jgi:predicted DNA-binding transcriptional regulator AlpA